MFIKRGVPEVFLGLSILFLGVLVILLCQVPEVSAATGRECTVGSNQFSSCGIGHNINQIGYGAVELCQVCYQCGGASDGVCPESYSDGRNETQAVKKTVYMREPRTVFDGSKYTVAFQTGKLACASIGGNCSEVQRSTTGFGTWQTLSPASVYCNWNVSIVDPFNNAYFRTVCVNVPRNAGCEYCPDPDCTTTVSGMTLDANDGQPVDGVTVSITSSANPLLNIPTAQSDAIGQFQMSAVTGQLTFTCSKVGYAPYSIQRRLFPGRNIVDCSMNNVSCSVNCTTVNNLGQEICHASCDLQNSCAFFNETTKATCDNQPVGTILQIGPSTTNCTHEFTPMVTCCNGAPYVDVLPCLGGICNDPNCIIPPDCGDPGDPGYFCCMNPTDPTCICASDPNPACCLNPGPTGYNCCVDPTDPSCIGCSFDPNPACCLNPVPTYNCCVNPTDPSCGSASGNSTVNNTNNIYGSDVSSIITRNYRRELYGIPVTLKIIVYEK
jgi:hypothetical protein